MGKTESVRIAPRIVLYKQRWSRFWYVRSYIWIDGQYVHTASTKTEDLKSATRFAFSFYLDCLRASQGDGPVPARLLKRRESRKRFDRIVDLWIDELTLDAGTDEKRLRDVRDKRSVCYSPNGLCAFLGKDDIDKIDTDRIKEMLRSTEEHSKKDKLASSTMKRILIVLGLILKFAAAKGLLTALPAMPKVRVGQAWIKHLSQVDGVPITQEAGSPNQFEDIFLVGDEDWPKLGEAWQEESGDA